MVITVSTTDPRSVKALAILADSGQWLKLRTHDGHKYYGVRSQANPETVYSVDCHGCDCPDFLGRLDRGGPGGPCKHMLAVILFCARVNGRKAQLDAARRRRSLKAAPAPTYRPRPQDAGLGPPNPSDLDRQATPKAAAEYGEVYGADPGHNPATCRLAVCADC